ncbi:serine hydrolase domain-containing protein [Ureibacillus sp. MALMAid1270]|uniref:serine hydrolase domain-containing protein n=1 Tax=Ureibacillus sp. MALMAid1270 TaxID=3411629 RepID=UPI003BA61199
MKEKKIIKWIKRYEENGYLNGSILIASKGEILLNKGFGIANWEHMVPHRATTKFRIGSLTKAFTAFAIFQLHEKGKLSIDDYLNKYLTAFPHEDRITIYQCLTNSSGIPNYTSFPDFWSTTMRLPMTLEQLIDRFKGLPLDFEPGSKFDYSNSGYAILTAIIENISGMTYADYIKENICIPLGLNNTGCDDGIQIVPNLASGYSYWEKPIHSAFTDLSFPLGAYGLYSTTEDLFLWEQALRSYKLLSED